MVKENSDVRYGFTDQFLRASLLFARRCKEIEQDHPDNPDERIRTEHRGLVVAAIMQCMAAVETEAAEVVMYGPEHHLGSNASDASKEAWKFLAPSPLSNAIMGRGRNATAQYELILHLLRKPPLKGTRPWQDMTTLVMLRNELTHYKSEWGSEMDLSWFKRFQQLHLPKPPFVSAGRLFFPDQCLSAACAECSVRSAVAFLNAVDERLEVESRFTSIMEESTEL